VQLTVGGLSATLTQSGYFRVARDTRTIGGTESKAVAGRAWWLKTLLGVVEPSVLVCPHFVDYLPHCGNHRLRRFRHVVVRIRDYLLTTR
jgi:hypothetical protein